MLTRIVLIGVFTLLHVFPAFSQERPHPTRDFPDDLSYGEEVRAEFPDAPRDGGDFTRDSENLQWVSHYASGLAPGYVVPE